MKEPPLTTPSPQAMATVSGIAASRGFAAGPVFVYRPDEELTVPEYEILPACVEEECARYENARHQTHAQIEHLIEKLRAQEPSSAAIFESHLMILEDVGTNRTIFTTIRTQRLNAEAAVWRTVLSCRQSFARMKDAYIRERVRDVEDVAKRVLFHLMGRALSSFDQIKEPVIVVASDLSPTETVSLPEGLVLGFATDGGSVTSHAALLARARGLPAVVGLRQIVSRVKPGDEVLLDGTTGALTLNPDVKTCAEFARLVKRERELISLVEQDRTGHTKDGFPIQFCLNAQPGVPLGSLASFGAVGVGLYRTEYLWLTSDHEPTEEEQTRDYENVVRAAHVMGPHARVVFRALDIGGDKVTGAIQMHEPNPFLGCRSIRWLLHHRAQFRTQIRAILRASALGPTALMWPMVATLEEVREARHELALAQNELRAQHIPFDEKMPVGCMIEIPSAALCAQQLAHEVDFFSVGTNDLVQYTLAADRGNALVSNLYQPTHPAVLRLMENTISAAQEAHIPVAVCGETASDPVMGTLWLGMGVTELSMSASYIPVMRSVVRELTRGEMQELAHLAHELALRQTASEIYNACRTFILKRVPRLEEIQLSFQ